MFEFITSTTTAVLGWINSIAGGNQILAATLLAGIAIIGRRLPLTLWRMIERQLTIELTVKDSGILDRDELIDAIVNSGAARKGLFSRRFIATLNPTSRCLEVQTGLGWHIVRLGKHWVLVRLSHMEVDEGFLRIVTVVAFRWWVKDIHSEVAKVGDLDEDVITEYHVNSSRWSSRHANFGVSGKIKRSRYADQRQLVNPEQYNLLLKYINIFVNDPEYFERNKLAHKFSFLLYGPPGTGKSTLVRHFACKFNLPIISVRPNELRQARTSAQTLGIKLAILLLDDIDEFTEIESVGLNRTAKKIGGGVGDLITNLDGVGPLDGFLVFINTNNVELLKSKLYRPGRIDVRMELTYPRPETIMWNIGYPVGDVRRVRLEDSGLLSTLPLCHVAQLSRAETLDEVDEIIKDCEGYFKLVEKCEVN